MKHEIIKATRKDIDGISLGDKQVKFGANGVAYTDDDGLAKEIKETYGRKGTGDVVVTNFKDKEEGHRYSFGSTRRFSNAWARFEARRTDRKSKTQPERS